MQLVHRNDRSRSVTSASLSKAVKHAAVYVCQAVILMLAVIGAFYLGDANTTRDSSASVAVVEEKPAPAGPITEFAYFPDQFVNQGTEPDEPIAQF